MTDCIFCKIVRGEIPSQRLFEDDEMIAFNDISPQAPIHVLFVPKRHVANTDALTSSDAGLVGRMLLQASALARQRGIAEAGYRLILNTNAEGGQTVYHLHLHLLGGRQLRALG